VKEKRARIRSRASICLISAAATLGGLSALVRDALAVPTSPQAAETLRASQLLKPVPDAMWNQIAGAQLSERYAIVRGDTLFDVSKRLFGDGKYWPKIWALNNGGITNPHLIRPGNVIQFMPGTGTTLPAIAIEVGGAAPTLLGKGEAGIRTADARGVSDVPTPLALIPWRDDRSQEWRKLPKQRWETLDFGVPPEVDATGFDTRSRVIRRYASGFELTTFATSEILPPLGTLTAAYHEGDMLRAGDTVFLESATGLQIGEAYAVTREPRRLKLRNSDRVGYSYPILGNVRVTGVKDGRFFGRIESQHAVIRRGDSLIPRIPRIHELPPIPGQASVEAVIFFDHANSTYTAAQFKIVYLDRGREDGVQPGMIFRKFRYRDASTGQKITDSDMIPEADIRVLHSTARFSTGVIIDSSSTLDENTSAVLMTDVTALIRHRHVREKAIDADTRTGVLDDLDQIDTSGGLGKEEEAELKQLENWEGNPVETQVQSQPETAPPADGAPLEESAPAEEDAAPESAPADGALAPPEESAPADDAPAGDGTESSAADEAPTDDAAAMDAALDQL
jgi:hypothetical protein